jgi:hypothetical protein
MEPSTLHMLGMHSASRLHPQPLFFKFIVQNLIFIYFPEVWLLGDYFMLSRFTLGNVDDLLLLALKVLCSGKPSVLKPRGWKPLTILQ